jgi:hypothetical protein
LINKQAIGTVCFEHHCLASCKINKTASQIET